MPSAALTLLLVGDRFAGFAVQEGVVTVTQFLEDMRRGVHADDSGPIRICVGQGVSVEDREAVWDQAILLGLADRVDLPNDEPGLAGRSEAHKHRDTNTLIANLRQDRSDLFSADLRVHNDNELLLDHQSGEHVQGMVSIEAARQMFLAVSERYFAVRHPRRKYYYVIGSMDTDFENFLFPLDATLEFRVATAQTTDPTRMTFTGSISIHQAGRRSSVTTVAYSAFEAHVLQAKEHRRGGSAVDYATAAAPALTPELAGV